MNQTKIDWSEYSWNPITGCTKCSLGCENCYAYRLAEWLKGSRKTDKYNAGPSKVVLHERCLSEPKWIKEPSKVFVCSMSDLYHPDVPTSFIHKVFEVMNDTPRHQYQVLTKRSARQAEMAPRLNWTGNIWAGVTVESRDYLHRLNDLRQVPSAIRWVSAEPLLSSLAGIDLTGISWVVCAGESGRGSRPMALDWARELRDLCVQKGVAFFFKQLGGEKRFPGDNILDGQEWLQYPR